MLPPWTTFQPMNLTATTPLVARSQWPITAPMPQHNYDVRNCHKGHDFILKTISGHTGFTHMHLTPRLISPHQPTWLCSGFWYWSKFHINNNSKCYNMRMDNGAITGLDHLSPSHTPSNFPISILSLSSSFLVGAFSLFGMNCCLSHLFCLQHRLTCNGPNNCLYDWSECRIFNMTVF